MKLNKSPLFISGLPRSGSTLMCQLLGMHPEVYSTGHSSPLAAALKRIRSGFSEDHFMMAQLDVDFDLGYQRIHNAMIGFINGWCAETDKPWVVDKNRGWLADLDLLKTLVPDFKMLVCVRRPDQILGSIESRHKKTALIDFPDNMANMTPYQRADKLCADQGVMGGPIQLIQAMQDQDQTTQSQLYYVVFEDLMTRPNDVMQGIYQWLGLDNHPFDAAQLPVKAHESDSYYRFKYPHKTHSQIKPPKEHQIPARIAKEVKDKYAWFYQTFYPGAL